MANAQNPNLEILELAIRQLGELADDYCRHGSRLRVIHHGFADDAFPAGTPASEIE